MHNRGDLVDNKQLYDQMIEQGKSLHSLAIDVAKSAGYQEAQKQTLDAINVSLGNVNEIRMQIATLIEKSKHADPAVVELDGRVKALEDKEQRTWVESLLKPLAAGAVGGGGLLALMRMLT